MESNIYIFWRGNISITDESRLLCLFIFSFLLFWVGGRRCGASVYDEDNTTKEGQRKGILKIFVPCYISLNSKGLDHSSTGSPGVGRVSPPRTIVTEVPSPTPALSGPDPNTWNTVTTPCGPPDLSRSEVSTTTVDFVSGPLHGRLCTRGVR